MLKRFSFTILLEVCICVFLSLAIFYSLEEILFAGLIIMFLSICAILYSHLFYKNMNKESIYEKQSSLAMALMCWEARKFKAGSVPHLAATNQIN